MDYRLKTKEQLIQELLELQQKVDAVNRNYAKKTKNDFSPHSTESLVHAINNAISLLLVNNNLNEAIEIGLAIIGKASGVDRAFFLKIPILIQI